MYQTLVYYTVYIFYDVLIQFDNANKLNALGIKSNF